MNHRKNICYLDAAHVTLTDAFWKEKLRLIREQMIPYQWEVLNDRMPGAAPSYCIRNFRLAAEVQKKRTEVTSKPVDVEWSERGFEKWPVDPEHLEETFYGFVFQDSDLYKWLEAVGWQLMLSPDKALEKQADEAIDLICSAQEPDGYLDTYYILGNKDKAFTNLKDHHELYCFGHLTEAAVVYAKATGKTRLLDAARRYADWIRQRLGKEEGKKRGYPGHEIAEMALAALYEATGDESFYELGKYFIDERGKKPYYYDSEQGIAPAGKNELRYEYNQAHQPVAEMEEAVGHAVRAVYLYAGVADYAGLSGDETYLAAGRRLWESITREKMYITGGIGATRFGEAFSFPYYLPNELAYSETCASIGMAMFDKRMLQIDMDSRYADDLEKQIYNTILAGMALDGKSFFYVNPLEVTPDLCGTEERSHVKPVRQKWFGCACCPPNIARFLSSIETCIASRDADTLYLHQYIGSEIRFGSLTLTVQANMPYDGNVKLRISSSEKEKRTIAVRIPGWCGQDYKADIPAGTQKEERGGYLYLTRPWDNDTVSFCFSMEPMIYLADFRVREDAGKAAVMRGPVCYCVEEADMGKDLHLLYMLPKEPLTQKKESVSTEEVITLIAKGLREIPAETPGQPLYRRFQPPQTEAAILKWIPYYTWANRGQGEMQVWTRYQL